MRLSIAGLIVVALAIAAVSHTTAAERADRSDAGSMPSPEEVAPDVRSVSASPGDPWVIHLEEPGSGVHRRAGFCTGSTKRPTLDVDRTAQGIPVRRWVVGTATQSCGSTSGYVQQVCVKLQSGVGPGNPIWYDENAWNKRCNTNTGPHVSASITMPCSVLGPGRYRLAARGRVQPSGSVEQTRYAYSSGVRYCQ